MREDYKEDISKINKELKELEPQVKEEKRQAKVQYLQQQLLQKFDAYSMCEEFFKEQPFYYDKNNIFWLWNIDKLLWEITDKTDILNAINSTFQILGISSTSLQSQIINSIELIGRKNTPRFKDNFNLIQFGKTIFDIETSRSFEATPEYFITNTLPYNPSINDETPTFDNLFDSWAGRENRELLYEIIAYCCYRDYPIHHIFTLVGAGSNGKSKYLGIIQKFIGVDNCCSTSLDTLMLSRFESANLYKKLVCLMGETNFNAMSKTEMLKRLSGQDLISFEFKGKTSFSGYNYAKLIISTNTLPETTDRTDGFYRRWVLIDFPNKFNGEFDILKTIPEQEYNNLARKVLNILPNLISYMRFTNVGTLEERKKDYENKSNPLPKFIEENIEIDINCFIFKWEFNARYNDYLKQHNLRSQSNTEIGLKMKSLDYLDRQVINSEDKKVRVWDGLKWKSVSNKYNDDEEIIK